MRVIVVLRDTADGKADLIRQDDNTYMFRQWKYPVGVGVCMIDEITLELHEMMSLLSTLLDEAEVWKTEAKQEKKETVVPDQPAVEVKQPNEVLIRIKIEK